MKERFLMCAPRHFEVAYVINPWMEGNIARGSNPVAASQWKDLLALLRRFAEVDCISAERGVPDLVFTANAGLVLDRQVLLSAFRHAGHSDCSASTGAIPKRTRAVFGVTGT